jgi:ribosomal protein S4E
METETIQNLKNDVQCKVVKGTHIGKSGIVQDLNTSKTGHITITVEQKNGVRFKTLGRNVEIIVA